MFHICFLLEVKSNYSTQRADLRTLQHCLFAMLLFFPPFLFFNHLDYLNSLYFKSCLNKLLPKYYQCELKNFLKKFKI